LQEIGKLVRDIMKDAGMEEAGKLAEIREVWPSLSANARHAEPYRLENGELFVKVDSHAWAQELRYSVAELAEEIKRRKGIEIRSVKIKVNFK